MLNILLIADIVSKIISLVIFVCLAMWSIRNLKDHDVSYATAILRQVIKTIVSKGLLYFTGGPAERSIIRSIIGTITPNAYWSTHTVIDQSPRPLDSAAGSADAPGLLADAYGTQPINGPLAQDRLLNGIDRCWLAGRRLSWRRIVRIQNSGISIPLSLLKLGTFRCAR